MNSKIDRLPGPHSKFHPSKVMVDGETFEFFHHNIITCITKIYVRHDLTPHLKFKPERHYTDTDMTVRVYGDIHTGKWWWEIQVRVNLCRVFIFTANSIIEGCRKKHARCNYHSHLYLDR